MVILEGGSHLVLGDENQLAELPEDENRLMVALIGENQLVVALGDENRLAATKEAIADYFYYRIDMLL